MNLSCNQELEVFLKMPLVDQVDKAGKVKLPRASHWPQKPSPEAKRGS